MDLGGMLGAVTVLFAMVSKFMPDVRQAWRDVRRGALVTALQIWIYYLCAILFFGAEYARARGELKGRPARPKSTAVLVREEIVEES